MQLITARQILRPLVPDDARALFDLDADPIVRQYVPDEAPVSVDAVRASLERYQGVYRDDGFARLAAIDRVTGALLGWCGLRRQPDGEVDLGYRYGRAAWGRGLATEASRASIADGFDRLELPRIIAHARCENGASLRVLEKIGMKRVGQAELAGHPCFGYAMSGSDPRL